MDSYIKFLIQGFWQTLRGNAFNSPNYTDLLHITRCIIQSHKIKSGDDDKLKQYQEDIDRISEKINDHLQMELAKCQLMIFKNWHKSPNSEIEVNGNAYKMVELYSALESDVIMKFCEIVTDIGQNYTLDISYGSDIFGGSSKTTLKGSE